MRSCCFLCLFVICVSYTSIALKFWCGTRPPSHGAANRQRKLTVTLFIMTIVSLLLWLPYVVYTFVSFFVLDRFSIRTYLRLKLSFRFCTTQTPLLIPLFTQSECRSSEELFWYYLNVEKDKMLLFLFMLVNTQREFLGRPLIFIDSVKHQQHGPPRDCLKANNCKCRRLLWRLLNFFLKHRHWIKVCGALRTPKVSV